MKLTDRYKAYRSNIPPVIRRDLSLIEYLALRLYVENEFLGHNGEDFSNEVINHETALNNYGFLRGDKVTKAGRELVENIEGCKHAE